MVKSTIEFFERSKVEDLHDFFSIEKNWKRAVRRLEWSYSNLMDFFEGKINVLIDVNFAEEFQHFFEWVQFDKSAQTDKNFCVLSEFKVQLALWVILELYDNNEIDNPDAIKQVEKFKKLYPKLEDWLTKNYQENSKRKNKSYTLYDEIKSNKKYLVNLPKVSYPEIFSKDGYELFCYLNSEYTSDNNSPKAKYSYLYHFLKYEQLIVSKQTKYIEFIEKKFDVKLSRIQSESEKYHKIKSILTSLRTTFKKSKKN